MRHPRLRKGRRRRGLEGLHAVLRKAAPLVRRRVEAHVPAGIGRVGHLHNVADSKRHLVGELGHVVALRNEAGVPRGALVHGLLHVHRVVRGQRQRNGRLGTRTQRRQGRRRLKRNAPSGARHDRVDGERRGHHWGEILRGGGRDDTRAGVQLLRANVHALGRPRLVRACVPHVAADARGNQHDGASNHAADDRALVRRARVERCRHGGRGRRGNTPCCRRRRRCRGIRGRTRACGRSSGGRRSARRSPGRSGRRRKGSGRGARLLRVGRRRWGVALPGIRDGNLARLERKLVVARREAQAHRLLLRRVQHGQNDVGEVRAAAREVRDRRPPQRQLRARRRLVRHRIDRDGRVPRRKDAELVHEHARSIAHLQLEHAVKRRVREDARRRRRQRHGRGHLNRRIAPTAVSGVRIRRAVRRRRSRNGHLNVRAKHLDAETGRERVRLHERDKLLANAVEVREGVLLCGVRVLRRRVRRVVRPAAAAAVVVRFGNRRRRRHAHRVRRRVANLQVDGRGRVARAPVPEGRRALGDDVDHLDARRVGAEQGRKVEDELRAVERVDRHAEREANLHDGRQHDVQNRAPAENHVHELRAALVIVGRRRAQHRRNELRALARLDRPGRVAGARDKDVVLGFDVAPVAVDVDALGVRIPRRNHDALVGARARKVETRAAGVRARHVERIVAAHAHDGEERREALEARVVLAPAVVLGAVEEIHRPVRRERERRQAARLRVRIEAFDDQQAVGSAGAAVRIPRLDALARQPIAHNSAEGSDVGGGKRAAAGRLERSGRDLRLVKANLGDRNDGAAGGAKEGPVDVRDDHVLEAVAVHVDAVGRVDPRGVRLVVKQAAFVGHPNPLHARKQVRVRRVRRLRVRRDGVVPPSARVLPEVRKGEPVAVDRSIECRIRHDLVPAVRGAKNLLHRERRQHQAGARGVRRRRHPRHMRGGRVAARALVRNADDQAVCRVHRLVQREVAHRAGTKDAEEEAQVRVGHGKVPHDDRRFNRRVDAKVPALVRAPMYSALI
eukprot:Opistho-1_new@14025